MLRYFTYFFIVFLCLRCSLEAETPPTASSTTSEVGTLPPRIDSVGTTIATRFSPPNGATRTVLDSSSFGFHLRHQELFPVGTPVSLYNGRLKANQNAHAAVLKVSIGKRDLQQCADAVMRLRGDFLWSKGRYEDIGFHFTNGFWANYSNWRMGQRIQVNGNSVNWTKTSRPDPSFASYDRYMNMVFAYAGTISLAKELTTKPPLQLQVGDVFVQGGSPGHAIIVVDVATNEQTGERYFMLAQSYMPAQHIHLLRNPQDTALSPWYRLDTSQQYVRTPEWTFSWRDLKSFE